MVGLSDDDFRPIVRNAPLLSVDIIITDGDGALLLGLRNNRPAKGSYFVPGGCVRKDETIAAAFERILTEETGITSSLPGARFLGLFEQFYPDNRFSDDGYGTHYVSLGYHLALSSRPNVRIDEQHAGFLWLTEFDERAHSYNRPYFAIARNART